MVIKFLKMGIKLKIKTFPKNHMSRFVEELGILSKGNGEESGLVVLLLHFVMFLCLYHDNILLFLLNGDANVVII